MRFVIGVNDDWIAPEDDGLSSPSERWGNDPLHGIDHGPCSAFAPDTLGDDPNVCTTCFYHRIDHAMDAGGIGHPLT